MESIKHLDKLKDYIKQDVEKILTALVSDYDIYQNGNPVDKVVVLNKLLLDLSTINKCNAVVGGKLCKNRCYNTFKYCKKHINLSQINHTSQPIQLTTITQTPHNPTQKDLSNYTKKIIDDTLYYITESSQFIFDDNLERVGYISDDNYILTDDPFILEFV